MKFLDFKDRASQWPLAYRGWQKRKDKQKHEQQYANKSIPTDVRAFIQVLLTGHVIYDIAFAAMGRWDKAKYGRAPTFNGSFQASFKY